MDFTMMTLDEISTGGGTYGIAAPAVDYSESLPTYLRITDIDDYGNYDPSDKKSVADPEAINYTLTEGDIVFARTGNSTGRFYLYDKRDGTFSFAGFLIKFHINEKIVNPLYIKYYCSTPAYRGWVSSNLTGSTRGNLNAKQFGKMIIPIPSREVQDEIAKIYSMMDSKIRVNKQINDNLLLQKQTAFRELMLTVSDCELTTLESIANLQKQTWKPSDRLEMLEHYSIPAFDEKKYPSFDESTTIQSNKTIVTPDCILVSKLNPETKRVWRPICITNKAVCSTEFLAIIPKKKEYAQYIYSIIDSDEFTDYLINNATGSTGSRQRVLPGTAMLFELPLPQASAIEDYSYLSESIECAIKNNLLEIQKLTELRDYLLPKLMSGEIDVSALEIPN